MIIVAILLSGAGALLVFLAGRAIIGRFAKRELIAIRYRLKFRPARPAQRYRLKLEKKPE